MKALPTRSTFQDLKPREQIFVDHYIKNMRQKEAALAAGFKPSTASISAFQMMGRPHVANAIAKALKEKSILARIDASWVLKRLAILADFSIKNFIVIDDNGKLYYDFTQATDDDWYCINEITISPVKAKHKRGDKLWVNEVRIKVTPQIKALELVGKHIDVQAFNDRVDISGTVVITEVTRKIVTEPPARPVIDVTPEPAQAGRAPRPKIPISGPVQ